MKQRLKLALAFTQKADVYFLDEPGTNLDSRAFEWFIAEMKDLPKEAIIFIAQITRMRPATATTLNITDYKKRKRI